MKQPTQKHRDQETEPDWQIGLTCIECGEKDVVSEQWADFHEIDNTNFVCHNCQYLYD